VSSFFDDTCYGVVLTIDPLPGKGGLTCFVAIFEVDFFFCSAARDLRLSCCLSAVLKIHLFDVVGIAISVLCIMSGLLPTSSLLKADWLLLSLMEESAEVIAGDRLFLLAEACLTR
jgi:hypothetical protein